MGAQRGGGLSSAPGNARPPLCPYKACGGPGAWGRAALATLRGGQALRCGSRPGGHAHLRTGPRFPTAAPDAPHGLGRAATTAPRGTARSGSGCRRSRRSLRTSPAAPPPAPLPFPRFGPRTAVGRAVRAVAKATREGRGASGRGREEGGSAGGSDVTSRAAGPGRRVPVFQGGAGAARSGGGSWRGPPPSRR